jgi:hypothetical protein
LWVCPNPDSWIMKQNESFERSTELGKMKTSLADRNLEGEISL